MSIETITESRRAAAILSHPIRPRILAQARAPVSASDLARALGQTRQRVNYHVRQLARAGFLKAVGQQRKRNMVEQQYVASARAYVLTPDVLGEAAPRLERAQDEASAAHLVALCARAESEVAQVMASANAAGLRARTMSLQSDIRFESVEQRAQFTKALMEAVSDVVARFTSPFATSGGDPAPGRPFRLLLGCYPIPSEKTK
jgi:DNA-binding transcriptional ArsR family regulator